MAGITKIIPAIKAYDISLIFGIIRLINSLEKEPVFFMISKSLPGVSLSDQPP